MTLRRRSLPNDVLEPDRAPEAMAGSAAATPPQTRRCGVWRLVGPVLAVAAVATPVVAFSVATLNPAFAGGPTLIGSGGSYPAVAIDQWIAQISILDGDSIDYATTSSVIGLNEFAQQQVDFAGSEIGYSTGQAQYAPASGYAYQYLPDVAGATCLMYNLTNRAGQRTTSLHLDSSVMAQIFTGTITKWDNPAIAALNPSALLPSSPIVVVFRTDASGENFLFSDYLNQVQPAIWHAFTRTLGFPQAAQAIWPVPQEQGGTGGYNFSSWVGQSGSDNASNYVASSPGTITYVETAYAILHKAPCASVENASGHWVEPSEYNDAVALERAQLLPDLEQKLGGVYRNPLPSAYPISAYSYLITPESQTAPQKGAVLGQFIQYFACAGQQAAGQLGYSPLPPNLVEEDFKGIARINGAARPPSAPTAANCQNPYVDGQTPLPGEPVIAGTGGNNSAGSGNKNGGSTTGGPNSTRSGKTGAPVSQSTGKTGRDASSGSRTSSGGTGGRADGVLATGLWPGETVLGGSGKLQDGEIIGSALESAGIGLSTRAAPTAAFVGGALALLALIGLPPVVAFLRRRRGPERPEVAGDTA